LSHAPTANASLDNLTNAFDWLDGGDVILGRGDEYFMAITAPCAANSLSGFAGNRRQVGAAERC